MARGAAALLLAAATVAVGVLGALPPPAAAYFVLVEPPATVMVACRSAGTPSTCGARGAASCPSATRGYARNAAPGAVWARGSRQDVHWTSSGLPPVGMVRLALVPAAKAAATGTSGGVDTYAFWWGCWGGYAHGCHGGCKGHGGHGGGDSGHDHGSHDHGSDDHGSDGHGSHDHGSHDHGSHDHGSHSVRMSTGGGAPACAGTGKCAVRLEAGSYGALVTVPTVARDGDYVLYAVWFGGGDLGGTATRHTYHSCSTVRVRGGPSTRTWQPRFVPALNKAKDVPMLKGGYPATLGGYGTAKQRTTSCPSASSNWKPCAAPTKFCRRRRVTWRVPAPFARGARPPPLKRSAYPGGK